MASLVILIFYRKGIPCEVKDWERPIGKSDVEKERLRGMERRFCKSVFIKKAIKHVKRHHKGEINCFMN